jgi:crotonobetainyl-CoA:carnitine CoA-transferase CaiB-like acyl-CoA transferase
MVQMNEAGLAGGEGPLAGLRICDLSGQLAGAGATRTLAALGAEVIRVEDPSNHGAWDLLRVAGPFPGGEVGTNRSAAFNNHNVGKLGVTLNLRTEKGKQLLDELIAVSDVVTENFAAGVFARLGYPYETLAAIKPDLIYVSHSGFGSTGPYARFKSWGPIVQAFSGLTGLSRLPEMEPAGWGYSYMDHLGAWYMAIAILAALHHRERTGEGQWIDMAGTEAGANLLGTYFLDYTVNDRERSEDPAWSSNRSVSPLMSPHGIYPTALEDRWVSIACRNDEEWARLITVLGEPWCEEAFFETLAGRLEQIDELDRQLGDWCSRRDHGEIVELLRSVRVAVAAVASPEERIDGDLAAASFGLWPEVTHAELGPLRVEGLPYRLSNAEWSMTRGAPCLGEHNEQVFCDLLGHDLDELDELRKTGVL